MSKGWIKLHRQLQDHWLWKEKRVFSKAEAWLDLLMSANHSSNDIVIKNIILTCLPGQTLQSLETLSKHWGWSRSKVKRFLDLLSKRGKIETANETVTSRITICNWAIYQISETDTGTDDGTNTKQKRNTCETGTDTNKNVNNNKKDKNDKEKAVDIFTDIPIELDTQKFRDSWNEYIEYRKQRKDKPLTTIGTRKKWAQLAKWGEARAITAIDDSIASGWQGIFERENKNNFSNNKPAIDHYAGCSNI